MDVAWTMGVLFLVVVIGIIVFIVLASVEPGEGDKRLPEEVDIVLVDKGRNRHHAQIAGVAKNMSWANSVIVVRTKTKVFYSNDVPENVAKTDIPVVYIDAESDDQEHILMTLSNLYNAVARDVIFLGDSTTPLKKISVRRMWSRSFKKRMFNYIQPDADAAGFAKHFEDTVPVCVFNLSDLIAAGSVENYVLSLALTDELVFSPAINRNVVLIDNVYSDNHQIEADAETELFLTVHVSPTITGDVLKRLNQRVLDEVL